MPAIGNKEFTCILRATIASGQEMESLASKHQRQTARCAE